MNARLEFEQVIVDHLLPQFCDHYGLSTSGFRAETLQRVTDDDARWFLEALQIRLVSSEKAYFRMPRSGAAEMIFWHGRKSITPRPLSIWVEPIITIGAAARLHLQLGWPKELIGLQSRGNWAFDLVAYRPVGNPPEYAPELVCEVKKSRGEVDALTLALHKYVSASAQQAEPKQGSLRNAYKKALYILKTSPKVVWALGPAGYGKAFRFVERSADQPPAAARSRYAGARMAGGRINDAIRCCKDG